MFSALLEKLQRREDLTVDEAAAAMEEIMEGRAQPAQIVWLIELCVLRAMLALQVAARAHVQDEVRRSFEWCQPVRSCCQTHVTKGPLCERILFHKHSVAAVSGDEPARIPAAQQRSTGCRDLGRT